MRAVVHPGGPPARRLSGKGAAAVTGLCVFALVAWQALTTVGRSGAIDSAEYLLNAQYLDAHGHLPPDYVSYEYSAPPLFEAAAVGLEHAMRWLPSAAVELASNLATRLVWLGLAAGSLVLLSSASRRLRLAGVAGVVAAGAWGLDECLALARTQAWSAGQLIALASALGLIVVSGLIARELWPDRPARALGVMAFVAAYPVVLRLAVLFHPETTMAFLSALAVLLFVRAERRGWPARLGAATGVVLGLDLLTRQSAVVVCFTIGSTAILLGGRRAGRYLLVAAATTLLLAGPWLGYAASTWGNPLQGNLERPAGGMVSGGEPVSFYVAFPIAAIVERPYRPSVENELLPKLHADLWSDWYGVLHSGAPASRLDRVTASSQSILGLAGDALALGGLAVFGAPAFVRVLRRRRRDQADGVLAVLAVLAVSALVAFALQIVRYPQIQGREIKASYLLFTAPAWAVFSVSAWLWLARGTWARLALWSLAGLYVVSYGTALASNLAQRYQPKLQLVIPSGYPELETSIQALKAPQAGAEFDFAVWVRNVGTAGAGQSRVHVRLDPSMRLIGRPYVSQGTGCVGTTALDCSLGIVSPGWTAQIRVPVELRGSGVDVLTATASSYGVQAHPSGEGASLTVVTP
jgi:hypothetical protein